MSAIIEMENIQKYYRQGKIETPALSNINFSLNENDFVALTGPSGSGKSTLLNLCGLIDQPSSGKVNFYGKDISQNSEKELCTIRRQQLGFVFQGFNLIPVMSVFDNIEYPLTLLGIAPKKSKQRTQQILEEVGLTSFANQLPDQISGGQKQRVAIARALISKPKLVIADEPTANLDSQTASEIIQLMQQLHDQSGTAFIIATHDERMSSQCKSIYQLHDGVLL